MGIDTSVTFSRDAGTASLAIFVDGNPTTTYSLAPDGLVTITPISLVVVQAADWIVFVDDVHTRFIRTVMGLAEVRPADGPLGAFLLRETHTTTPEGITARVELGPEPPFVLVRFEYAQATGQIEFKPRGGTTMTWADFRRWYDFFRVLATDIRKLAP
jgi:hypothetical protein